MLKIKTHNAYIIIKIYKESYIKKKSHNDSFKNRCDSRRLQNIAIFLFICYTKQKNK